MDFREIFTTYCGCHTNPINIFSEKEDLNRMKDNSRSLLEILTASCMMQNVYSCHS